ncbi:hypothetical protein B0H13DRAFT_2315837 [Mycena leptocephala]|nr:hypothetical protein B0H13DRAFT_2315837 [Mycena leptocephala]
MLLPRPHAREPCAPPLFTPGNIDLDARSRRTALKFYVVFEGHLQGIFTEEHEARLQVNGVSNSTWRKATTWVHALEIWDELCARYHGDGCPDFEIPATSLSDSPPRDPGPPMPPTPSTPRCPAPSTPRRSAPSTPRRSASSTPAPMTTTLPRRAAATPPSSTSSPRPRTVAVRINVSTSVHFVHQSSPATPLARTVTSTSSLTSGMTRTASPRTPARDDGRDLDGTMARLNLVDDFTPRGFEDEDEGH